VEVVWCCIFSHFDELWWLLREMDRRRRNVRKYTVSLPFDLGSTYHTSNARIPLHLHLCEHVLLLLHASLTQASESKQG
jgi:hypothetical protein